MPGVLVCAISLRISQFSVYLYQDQYSYQGYWCTPCPYSSNFLLTQLHIYALGILLLRCLQSRDALKWIHTGMDVNKRECDVTSGCPKPRAAACWKGSLLWGFFIPFSPTGISRWEWTRQGMVKKLCGQSNWTNAERKVITTLLGDSSDYFLSGIRHSILSQMALELPSLPLPLHTEHGWTNKQKTFRKFTGESVKAAAKSPWQKYLACFWMKKEIQIFLPSIHSLISPNNLSEQQRSRRVDCKLYLL